MKFGNHVTKVDEYCCANASNLTSVNVTTNTTLFADHSFENCSKLSTFYPFANGTPICTVGNNSFAGTGLKDIILNLQSDDDAHYDYQGCILTDKDHGPFAGHHAFANCKSLKSVKFLRSTELGSHMFDGCTSLTAVDISSDSLSGSCVGEYAFANCTSLSSITLPYRFEMIS